MVQSDSTSGNADLPRSHRVASVPTDFQPSDPGLASPSSPQPASPPLPPRSPLRPKANTLSIVTRSSITSCESSSDLDPEHMTLLHSRSFGTLSGLMDSSSKLRPKTPEKPLPLPPPSPEPLPEELEQEDELEHDEIARSFSSSYPPPTTPTLSKRTHALLELLSSERAYASDLALIRDIHIPLALGQPAPFQTTPPTPPSSGSSSRTLSTASDSSSGSTLGAPMTEKDTKIIFMNVAEIAMFSDMFTERLEEALGGVLEGGSGEDHVGALFLEMIPQLEPLYGAYITRHPTALEHLNSLPQTPSLTAYLAHTRTLAESLTHAWDLSSLLIKPVQRLLKYSLLLGAIIDETPDAHADKQNLKKAREKMEAVAHGVNEGRRRREVVKEVLTGVPVAKVGEASKAKKKGLNVGVAASVSLGRMKSIRAAAFKVKEGAEANQEAEQVSKMGEELKACEKFIGTFSKDTALWVKTLTGLMLGLRTWTLSFGQVIGVSEDQHSEAFDAFVAVIEHRLLPICDKLDKVLREQLRPQLDRLTESMSAPERLLEAMRTLEPLHYGLLNFNVSKSRPPPQLLEASKSYVALRAQLFAELPKYLQLLNRGILAAIMQFVAWQSEFWCAVREKWGELWDALKVDGEMQGEATETLKVWWSRFAQVEASVAGLNIVRPPVKKDRDRDKETELLRARMRGRGRSFSGIETGSTTSTIIVSTLAALDPIYMPASPSSSQTLVASPSSGKARTLERRPSNESLHSKKSGRSSKGSHKHSNSNASHQHLHMMPDMYEREAHSSTPPSRPPNSRTPSMPISMPMPLRKSSSQGRLLDSYSDAPSSSSQLAPVHSEQYDEPETTRGRMTRKPSIKRRLTDTLRPSASSSQHRRSPSLPSMKELSLTPDHSPRQHYFAPVQQPRYTLAHLPMMYQCRAVHDLHPPEHSLYRGFPFCWVDRGEIYDILQEQGHPSLHPDLPLVVDEGEDCLLLARDQMGNVGWALASYLLPVD